MPTTPKESREGRISLRATPSQRRMLEQAAEAAGKTLTAFVLDAAALEAQRALLDRRFFALAEAEWARFIEALDEPVTKRPRLRRLLNTPGILG